MVYGCFFVALWEVVKRIVLKIKDIPVIIPQGVTIYGRWLEPLLLLCFIHKNSSGCILRKYKRGGVANAYIRRAHWSFEFTHWCFQPWLHVWRKQYKKITTLDPESLWLFLLLL